MAQRVFICHSTSDKTVADQICRVLETDGIACWLAPRDVMPGAEWAKAIVAAIDGCAVFLLVYTSSANTSSQVLREVERAVRREKTIVNYRLENIACSESLDYYLAVHQWFDRADPSLEADVRRLAVNLKRLCAPGNVNADAATRPETIGVAQPSPAVTSKRVSQPAAATVTFTCPRAGAWRIIDFPHPVVEIDGTVVAKVSIKNGFEIQRQLPLGTHELAIRMPPLRLTRKYHLFLNDPGVYRIKLAWSEFWKYYSKRCEISRDDSPPVYIRGSWLVTKWHILAGGVVLGALLIAALVSKFGF